MRLLLRLVYYRHFLGEMQHGYFKQPRTLNAPADISSHNRQHAVIELSAHKAVILAQRIYKGYRSSAAIICRQPEHIVYFRRNKGISYNLAVAVHYQPAFYLFIPEHALRASAQHYLASKRSSRYVLVAIDSYYLFGYIRFMLYILPEGRNGKL